MARILHVGAAFKSYESLDPEVVVAAIHKKMYDDYQKKMNQTVTIGGISYNASGSRGAAAELQQFFQAIKEYNMNGSISDDVLDEAAQATIADVVATATKGRFKNLFQSVAKNKGQRQWQGQVFEKQVAEVVAAVNNLSTGGNGDRKIVRNVAKAVNIGTRGGVDIDIDGMADSMLRQLTETSYSEIGKKFNQSTKNNKGSKFVGKKVEGKIDISGHMCQWDITVEPTTYLHRIATLLSTANFTAKSYASSKMVYDKTIREKVQILSKNMNLHLGSTNLNRVFIDILTSFGYPTPVAASMIIVLNQRGEHNEELYKQMSALRFIYELTGRGQNYVSSIIQDALRANGEDYNEANYMIYNDPASGDIFVKSTAEIIIDLWDVINEEFSRVVGIEKAYFK